MDKLYVLVWDDFGTEVVPFDCNPSHKDQGMLVYRSKEAADMAAEHQTDLYGDDNHIATSILLSEFLER